MMKKIRRIISIILLGVDPYLEIRTTLEYNNQNIKYFSKSFNVEDDNLYKMKGLWFESESEFWLTKKNNQIHFRIAPNSKIIMRLFLLMFCLAPYVTYGRIDILPYSLSFLLLLNLFYYAFQIKTTQLIKMKAQFIEQYLNTDRSE
jgi:hypothetical protein